MKPAALGAPGSALALYVHMPWCVRKCPYCDFNSHQLKSATPDAGYIDALLSDFDAESLGISGRVIDSIFFGGGTPSLFPPHDFERLLLALRERATFADDVEITLEANPGTIERGRFAGYRAAGINRVSLGAQTFSQTGLQRLGRIHTASDTRLAIDELHAAGIANFNIDMMYALPEQSLEEALADVRMACALQPAHISYYQLTLEPGTVFFSRPPALPDEDAAWLIETHGRALLAEAGYAQYEVSAYALPGRRCRHNLNYWTFGDYLGIGAGAHGKLTLSMPNRIVRSVKPKQPRDFLQCIAAGHGGERRPIAIADLPFEFILNASRLKEGFPHGLFEQRTGLPAASLDAPMAVARMQGLMECTHFGWVPTELGRRFLNDLQAGFLA